MRSASARLMDLLTWAAVVSGLSAAVLVAPDTVSILLGIAIPLLAFIGQWMLVIKRESSAGDDPRPSQLPRAERAVYPALAVAWLGLAVLAFIGAFLPPLAWVAFGWIVVAIAARDMRVLAAAVVVAVLAFVATPWWPIALVSPNATAITSLVIFATLFASAAVVLHIRDGKYERVHSPT